ncbi:MAG: hypothetical protein WC471_03695 [Candidatus Woesearchaeota archaeon]
MSDTSKTSKWVTEICLVGLLLVFCGVFCWFGCEVYTNTRKNLDDQACHEYIKIGPTLHFVWGVRADQVRITLINGGTIEKNSLEVIDRPPSRRVTVYRFSLSGMKLPVMKEKIIWNGELYERIVDAGRLSEAQGELVDYLNEGDAAKLGPWL